MADERPYHHGDLRSALLDAAIDAIGEGGVATLSLRGLARRVGVSHAAPAHHFGDKVGLLTALAAQGAELLADDLQQAWDGTNDFAEVGVAYIRFAVEHPAHFEVLYLPELREDDPDLQAARQRGAAALYGPAGATVADADLDTGLLAWSAAHGFAVLWLGGNLQPRLGDDAVAAARRLLPQLFGGAAIS